MATQQLPLFTTDAAGVDNLNTVVQFLNQLWLFVYSFFDGPNNLQVFDQSPINLAPDNTVSIVKNTLGTGIVVNLPLLPYANEKHVIKDGSGNAGTSNITVNGGGILIDGQSSYVINFNYGAVTVVYDGAAWNAIA